MRFSLVLATMALATSAFGAEPTAPAARQDGEFQIGYAANLNIGDSIVNLSNNGVNAGVFGAIPATLGNICANVYVFDPQEEEIGCCACLVTPNGLNSLSVKSDLISNNLTPAVPTSIVIKLLGSVPGTTTGTIYNQCNPSKVVPTVVPGTDFVANELTNGLLAWGVTLEPSGTPGTYNPMEVQFLQAGLSHRTPGTAAAPIPTTGTPGELEGMTSLCNFIQANGTGYGICKSCRLGALGGSRK